MSKLPKITGVQRRGFTVNRAAIDEEARTVTLSFSSENPVKRWFGLEILSHEKGAVDLERLNNRAALLLNHDPDKQVGVVESATVGSGKGRAVVRFGESALATEVFNDVKAGIRSNVSVGYEVHKVEPAAKVDGQDAFRVTRWEPLELSIVSIPADKKVGVGRSKGNMNQLEDSPEIEEGENQKEYEQTILRIGRTAGCEADAKRAIVAGRSVEDFRKFALAKMPKAQPLGEWESGFDREQEQNKDQFGDVGLSEKEIKRYSITRALENFCRNSRWDGLEAEASRAAAKKYKLDGDGLHVPQEIFTAPHQRASFQVGSFSSGGVFVENQMGSVIDKLRNECLAVSLGARTMSGLVGQSVSPTITGDATAYWVSELAAITESEPTTGQLVMTPKRLGALCYLSRKLTVQTSVDCESLLRDNIAKVMAVAIDLAIINGSGASAQPLGIMGTTGVGSVTFTTAATWAKILSFETTLATANVRPSRAGWLTTPATRAKWKAIQRFTSTDTPLWTDANTVNGYPAYATNQVPSDKVIFCDWNDVLIGSWAGGFSVIPDIFTRAKEGIIGLTVEQYADVALGHAASAVVSTDSGAQ